MYNNWSNQVLVTDVKYVCACGWCMVGWALVSSVWAGDLFSFLHNMFTGKICHRYKKKPHIADSHMQCHNSLIVWSCCPIPNLNPVLF